MQQVEEKVVLLWENLKLLNYTIDFSKNYLKLTIVNVDHIFRVILKIAMDQDFCPIFFKAYKSAIQFSFKLLII